jgi:hypothetical protein
MHRGDSDIRICQRVSEIGQTMRDIWMKGEYVRLAFIGQRDTSMRRAKSHLPIISKNQGFPLIFIREPKEIMEKDGTLHYIDR